LLAASGLKDVAHGLADGVKEILPLAVTVALVGKGFSMLMEGLGQGKKK